MLRTADRSSLSAYFNKSGQFFFLLLDREGVCRHCNPLFEQLFGGNRIIDQHYTTLFAEGKKLDDVIDRCFNGNESSVPVELHSQIPGGHLKNIRWEFSLAETNEGHFLQGIGMSPDIHFAFAQNGKESIPERYKAYEQSTEGVWCFDSKYPVVATIDPDEIIEFWRKNSYLAECNDSMARMYGFESASELVGTSLDQLLDYSDHNRMENIRRFIRNDFRPTQVETKEFDRYGRTKYFLNTMEGIIENGLIKRVWGTQQDITEQRIAEEKIRYLAMLMENVSDIIISQDKDFNIVSWNQPAETIYGYTAAEMIGHKIHELLHFEFQGITRTEFFQVLEEKGSWKGEAYTVNRWGQQLTVLVTITRIMDENGKHTGYVSVSKDITEKRRSEEQLQQSEHFYRNLIAESLDGVLLTDAEGLISFTSPSVTKILGYEPPDLNGTNLFEYVFREDMDLAVSSFRDEVRMEAVLKFINIRLLHKDGKKVWCVVRGHNMLENSYVGKMVIYFADDSLRKKAEQDLLESERRFRTQATVLGNVTDVIVTIDLEKKVISWNKVTEKLTGITGEEAIGKEFTKVLNTDYSPFTNEQVTDIVLREGIWRGEISFTGHDGEKKYLLHTFSRLHNEQGDTIGMLGVGKEITERKKIEARLQQSESFYRTLAANSLDGILMTDKEGRINYCGPSIINITGYELDQLLGRVIFEYVHPDDLQMAHEAFMSELNGQTTVNYIIVRLRHANRGWVWCTVRGHNLLNDPVLQSMVIYFTDDTKRKQIEDRLRESETRFRELIHNLKLGIILMNEQSEVLVSNHAALQMLGMTEEQLKGWKSRDPSWSITREDGSVFPDEELPVMTAIRTRRSVKDIVMGVFRPSTNDKIWLLVNAEPMFDSGGGIINVVCSLADITEQRRLSQQLVEQEIQKQKLITQATIDGQEKERQEIGKELHDNINQHLTTTRLYLEVASEIANGRVLEMIRLAHKNLADTVNEIRSLSQSLVPPTLGDLGLAESIQDLCDSLRRAHSFNVVFQHRYFNEEDLPANLKLMIFRIIQEQVSNIIRHAEAKTIKIKLQADAENVIFNISDDGKGFDPLDYKKGMGFSNMSNRASLFEGRAEIEAAPGKGCTVTVTIPIIPPRELI